MIVTQGGNLVTIIDPKTSKRVELKAGRYELQLANGGAGLQLSTEAFALKRGDKPVVTVRRAPMAMMPMPRSIVGPPALESEPFEPGIRPRPPALEPGEPVETRSRQRSDAIPEVLTASGGRTIQAGGNSRPPRPRRPSRRDRAVPG